MLTRGWGRCGRALRRVRNKGFPCFWPGPHRRPGLHSENKESASGCKRGCVQSPWGPRRWKEAQGRSGVLGRPTVGYSVGATD